MRRLNLLFVLFTLLNAPLLLFAQEGYQVSGHIVSVDDNQPMIGVSVLEEGTTNGVITDIDGNYRITVTRSPAILQFSYIGMRTVERQVTAASRVDVKMETDAQQVDEVVVVAYGVRKKGTIAGSVSTVKAEKIENVPAASFDQALQGSTPGLSVISNSGEPSAVASFQIRGTNSINSGTAPLFILDGVAISSSDFNTLSPSDIESISVLKDASSTSIYGARAANGVVVITTKRGRRMDKAQVTFRTQMGFSQVAQDNWNLMDTNERIQFEKEVGLTTGQDYEKLGRTNINWFDEIFSDRALLQNYELSVNGATEKLNYFVSGSYYDQDGIAQGSSFKRYNLRANVEARANNWLKIGTNSMIAYEEYEQADDGNYSLYTPISACRFMLPYWNPYKTDGSYASTNDGTWAGTGLNPIEWMDNNPLARKKYKALSTVFAEINPIEGLIIRSQIGVDYGHATAYTQSFPSYSMNNGQGNAGRSTEDALNLTITNTANYRLNLEGGHSFNFLLGHEGVNYKYEGFTVSASGQNNDFLTNITSGTRAANWSDTSASYSYVSFFGRGEYNYLDRYYADFSVRTDASSRFGAEGRWATFWSVGLMWNLKNESFMKKYEWLTNAQISLSTGTSGNSSIPNYTHLALVSGGMNYGGEAGIAPSQPGNEKLGWEKLWSTNLGLHLGFINRINLDVEFYNKNTSNMLMEVPVSYSDKGFGYRWDNVGAMVNRGVEIQLGADVVRIKDFVWNVSANVSYNHNEITELYNGMDEYEMSGTNTKLVVGHSYGEFFINRYAGVNPANGDALWYDREGNVTTEFDEADKVMIGKSFVAPWQGGFGTSLTWRGVTLSGQFSWVANRYMINNDRFFEESNGLYSAYNQSKRMLYDRWKNPGDITDIPRYGVTPQFDTHLLENASFLRLKNVSLSYALPQNLLKRTNFFSHARVYVQGQNLLTFTKFSGLDPEGSGNLYAAKYPMSRQFTFGVEVSF